MKRQGKSCGLRTLVAANKGNRWAFVFGSPTKQCGHIDKDEAEALEKLAARWARHSVPVS
ncbi:type II toxin-antitoxin system RelE/ParE family toxin [Methylibium rhizosphaerae]|uniref:type II toxin-antitoxin system RelE/ParE family toxin n=1 Tax=Methylibium rhizosphaerae TaxID=2570323 RepID=UPI003CCC7313